LVAFTTTNPQELDVFILADNMRARGWYVQPQLSFESSPANIHLTIGNRTNVTEFFSDLKESIGLAKSSPRVAADAVNVMHEALAATGGVLTRPIFEKMMELVGFSTKAPPKTMVLVNSVLNSMTSDQRSQALTWTANEIFVHDDEYAELEAREFMQKKVAEIKSKVVRGVIVIGGLLAVAVVLKKTKFSH